jgi:hypothetical protein
MGTQVPVDPNDPLVYAQELEKKRKLLGALGEPAADPLSTAKLKLSMGMTEDNLTPEEQAALAAEQLVPVAPAAPAAPAAGEEGYLQKFLSMIGMGG